jgi:hypothetical protein
MDCAEVRDRLKAQAPTSPELVAHAAECPACHALIENEGSLARSLERAATMPPPELEALFRQLDGRLERERGILAWIQTRPTWLLRLLTLLSAVPMAIYLYGNYGFRHDRQFWPVWRMVGIEAAFAVASVGLVWLATRPFHKRQLSPSAIRLLSVAGIFLAFVIAALPLPHLVDPHSLPGDPVPATSLCYIWGLYMGTPVFVAALLLCREATLPRALALATAAGLISNLEIQLECSATARDHMVASHATISLTFAVGVLVLAGFLWLAGRFRKILRAM